MSTWLLPPSSLPRVSQLGYPGSPKAPGYLIRYRPSGWWQSIQYLGAPLTKPVVSGALSSTATFVRVAPAKIRTSLQSGLYSCLGGYHKACLAPPLILRYWYLAARWLLVVWGLCKKTVSKGKYQEIDTWVFLFELSFGSFCDLFIIIRTKSLTFVIRVRCKNNQLHNDLLIMIIHSNK